jgi:hypothetical protein
MQNYQAMSYSKVFAHVVTKGLYLLFCVVFVIWLAYTAFALLDFTLSFLKPFSWWIRLPGLALFSVFILPIVLLGGIPLFWLDAVQRNKIGWLGKLYSQLDDC